jgi:chemotaxis protein MotB
MAKSMQRAFNSSAPGTVQMAGMGSIDAPLTPPVPKPDGAGGVADLSGVRAQLQMKLATAVNAGRVSIEMDHRGLVISIREAGSFPESSAELSDAAKAILAQIGSALGSVENHVRIEGHTDEVPIHTDRFPSNWELSTARSSTVVRFMIERAGIPPQRFSAAGYAEYMPRVAGSTPEARARNRRVDIIVLSPPTQAAEEPARSEPPPPAR